MDGRHGAGGLRWRRPRHPLAMLIVVSPTLEPCFIRPWCDAEHSKIRSRPSSCMVRVGVTPKVAVAFLIAFFPIVIDTIVGLRSIDPAMIAARALHGRALVPQSS